MSYKTKCKNCKKTFTPARSSKRYCNDSCRVNYNQKKKRVASKIAATQQKISETDLAILLEEGNFKFSQQTLHSYQSQLADILKEIAYYEAELQKDAATFYRDHSSISKTANKHVHNWLGVGLAVGALLVAPKECEQKVQLFKGNLESQKMNKMRLEGLIRLQQSQVNLHERRISEGEKEKRKLAAVLDKLLISLHEEEHVNAKQMRQRQTSKEEGVGAQDFLNKKFNTFRLNGNIGAFLGDLDRDKLFITLTGDPGAGKSTITMGIAQKFDQAGLRVIFYSLELGKGKPLQDMIRRYPCSNNFRIVDKGDIDAVRKSAQQYDVVMIDSFGKLNCRAEELDKLRNEFSKTIFLSIVQKTTAGTSRGGAAINFDSSMVIDVIKEEDKESGKKRRMAYMEKSRYGTQDWKYYIEENECQPA